MEKNIPLVSVIMPVYNSGEFLNESIRSVLNQTYTNYELVIVNDASTDETSEILDNLVDTVNITIVNNDTNKGAGECRNIGLSYARGVYVAFLDSDDLWVDSKLEMQINFMLKNDRKVSHTSYNILQNGHVSNTVSALPCLSLKKYLKTTNIGFSTFVVEKSLLTANKIKFTDHRTRQDTRFIIKVLSKSNSYGLEKCLVNYRKHNNQISKNKLKMALNVFRLYNTELDFGFIERNIFFIHYLKNALVKHLLK